MEIRGYKRDATSDKLTLPRGVVIKPMGVNV